MTEPRYPLLSLSRLRMGVDGPGVTTLIAGAGCPLHCRWCINQRLLRDAPSESVTAEELYRRVKIDDLYFRASGGGVCFGGGESLLHAELIREFANLCPKEWMICAETSLAVERRNVALVQDCVELFLVDCKDMNPDIYRRYTGGDAAQMKDNLRYLLDTVGPERVVVRVPLIPEFNTPEDQARSVEELKAMGVTRLDCFSYVIRDD